VKMTTLEALAAWRTAQPWGMEGLLYRPDLI